MRRILRSLAPPRFLLWLACCLLLLGSAAPASAQITPRSEGAQLQLVDDPLYRGDLFYYRGDYYRAITQYELYLMRNPQPAQAAAVRLKIAWLYSQSDKLAASANELKKVRELVPATSRLALWARIYYGEVASRANQGRVAVRTYNELFDDCDGLAEEGARAKLADAVGPGDCVYLKSYAKLGLARHFASIHEFDASMKALRSLPEKSPLKVKAEALADHVEAIRIPRKRPVLAGALSIVPGLGHFYIEEYGAGIWAMAFNGAFIYAIVDSLASRKYGQATLITLVETIWYTGTIFGAVAGAHRFNRDARRIVQDGINKDLDTMQDQSPWPARFPIQDPALQLQWEWRF